MHRFDLATTPRTPWRNGGGATRELACWPPGSGPEEFDWRVSMATVAQSGPFSHFPGVDRVITLLSGEGMRLRHAQAGIDHPLNEPLQPFAFAGTPGPDCELLGGACEDFNLMTRRGRWHGAVRVLRGPALLPPRPAGLFLALQGRWDVALAPTAPCAPVALAQGSGVWWAEEDCSWNAAPQTEPQGSAVLLHVLLAPGGEAVENMHQNGL